MRWYRKQVVNAYDVEEFLNSLPDDSAETAKVTFDRDNSNDYCTTWYHIFYYAEREY